MNCINELKSKSYFIIADINYYRINYYHYIPMYIN